MIEYLCLMENLLSFNQIKIIELGDKSDLELALISFTLEVARKSRLKELPFRESKKNLDFSRS